MKEKKQAAFFRLTAYAGNRRWLTYLSLLLSAVSAVLSLMPFVYLWRIIREVLEVMPDYSKAMHILHNGHMAVAFALLAMLVYFAALMCSHLAAFRTAANLKKTLLRHIALLPAGFADELGSGRVRRIVTESTAATETLLAHNLPDLAGAVTTPVCMVVLLFLYDWRYGLLCLIPVVLGFAAMSRMAGPGMAEDMRLYQNALERMSNEAVEYVRGMPVVKTFGQTVFSFHRFQSAIDDYRDFCMHYTVTCRRPMLLFTVFVNSSFAFLICLTLALLHRSGYRTDILLNFLFYVILTPVIATTLNRVMFMSENGMLLNDAMARVDSLLEMPVLADVSAERPKQTSDSSDISPVRSGASASVAPDKALTGTEPVLAMTGTVSYSLTNGAPARESVHDMKGTAPAVELRDVTYRYKEDGTPAIDRLSLRVEARQVTALVGPSGSGKTTTAALIARFREAQEGQILVGGTDVRSIPKEELMQRIAYVFQDSHLLQRSIADNLRIAKPDATDAELLDALHRAQCDDILERLPDGMHTVLGSRGTYLSGGEQQRIAIARAMLKDADILILDEASAFADPESEVKVQQAFSEMAKNKTALLIAHRLSSISGADRIYVLDCGRVAECGRHAELLAKGGLYRSMWDEYQTSVSWKVGEHA